MLIYVASQRIITDQCAAIAKALEATYNSEEVVKELGYKTDTSLCSWHVEAKGLAKWVAPCAGDEYSAWLASYHSLYYAVDDSMTEEMWEQHWQDLVDRARDWQPAREFKRKGKVGQDMEADGHFLQGKYQHEYVSEEALIC